MIDKWTPVYDTGKSLRRIPAIPTPYKGYLFRSRLEARWAVFMDAFHWDWEYEPEGFDLGDVKYLPDFVLHDVSIIDFKHPCHNAMSSNVIIEPKGWMTNYDYQKVKAMQASGLDVLVVGDIPDGNSDKEILNNLRGLSHYHAQYALYCSEKICNGTDYERKACEGYDKSGQLSMWGMCPFVPDGFGNRFLWVGRNNEPIIGVWHTRTNRTDGDPIKTLEAFKQARQARFEHGESGYNNNL